MGYTRLFIWVEGSDDVRFFERIMKPRLEKKYDLVTVVKYAQLNKKKHKDYLASITQMNAEYIHTADLNDVPCVSAKKRKIRNKLRNIDENRIAVIIREIEGWYLAGLSSKDLGKFTVPLLRTTDDVTKEQFNSLMPKKFDSRIDFMLETLKCFSIEIAKQKNTSFRYFIGKYN